VTDGKTIFKPDEQVSITCYSNYAPVYITTACQTDRSWLPYPLCSDKRCTVSSLSNGRYYQNKNEVADGTALGYQSVITPSCFIGFVPIPDTPRTCQINGQWSDQPPNCTPIVCVSLPLAFNNGSYDIRVNVFSYAYNETITPKCDAGFFLYQGGERRCSGINSWSGETPVCSPITCKSPSAFSNGYYNDSQTNYTFGSVLAPTCNMGYNMTTYVESRTCERQDSWSGVSPVCDIVKCTEHLELYNGLLFKLDNETLEYQTVITIACNAGYEAEDGIWNSTCTENGTWSSVLQCVPVICNDSSDVEHKAIHVYPKPAFGEIANVTYNSTYFVKKNGSLQINCSSERKLSWVSKPYFGKLMSIVIVASSVV